MMLRDHSAFLNSYVPEDEGLYDDAAAKVREDNAAFLEGGSYNAEAGR
jgi:hypothetical protein